MVTDTRLMVVLLINTLLSGCLNLRRQYSDRLDAATDNVDLSDIGADVLSDRALADVLIDRSIDALIVDAAVDSADSSFGADSGDASVLPTCPPAFMLDPVFYPSEQAPTHFVCRNSMVTTSWTNAVRWCEQVGWRSFVPSMGEGDLLQSTICNGACPASGLVPLVPIALPATYIDTPVMFGMAACPQHLRFEPEPGSTDRYFRVCLQGPGHDSVGYWNWDTSLGFPLNDSSSKVAVMALFRSSSSRWQNAEAGVDRGYTIVCERP